MLRQALLARRMRKQSPASEKTMARSSPAQQASPAEQSTVRPTVAETTSAEAVAAETMKPAPALEATKAASPEPASPKSRVCLGRSSGQDDRCHQNQRSALQSCGRSRSSPVHGLDSLTFRNSIRFASFGSVARNLLEGISAGNCQSEKVAIYSGDPGSVR